ncbi:MAG: ADOP family duplicated permease [Vicinamibacteria bacterium]
MRALARLRHSLRALLRRDRLERELDLELRTHLELEIEQNRARGMREDEARRAALLAFGGVEQTKEACRDSRGTRLLETLAQDVRYALRSLRRAPAYTLAAVVTLGLGIGANSAVFSVVRGVLLQPLPYERGDQVVVLRQSAPLRGVADIGWSIPELTDLRRQTRTLDGIVEYHTMNFTLLGGEEPQRVRTGVVSANYFDVLEVRTLVGRGFRRGEDAHGAEPVLILAWDYWQKTFGGDPGIVGRRFTMNDRVHTVIGVLPPLPEWPDDNDVFMPASACPFRSGPQVEQNRGARMVQAFARVREGRTLDEARVDVETTAAAIRQEHPEAYAGNGVTRPELAPLREELTASARPTFLLLLATVSLILLIACANVANLALSRLLDRGRELALRQALGAGRRRIFAQLVTESTLLALAGGALGLLLAAGTLQLLVSFAARFTPRAAEVRLDPSVLAFTLGLSLLTGLLAGSLPGLPGLRSLAQALGGDGARATTGRGAQRLRQALVVSQVALSFVLVIGAALTLRSFRKLAAVDAGFRAEKVLAIAVDLNWSTYSTPQTTIDRERVARFYEPVHESLRSLPGVTGVGTAWTFPLNDSFSNDGSFLVEGGDADAEVLPRAVYVGTDGGYFATIGVPLLRGRSFSEDDRGGQEGVAIVSQALARRHFGNGDALGQRLSTNRGRSWRRIVGVVGDVRQSRLDREPKDMIYLPFRELPGYTATLFVRAQAEPRALGEQIRRLIHARDPQAAVAFVRSLEEIRSDALASPRLTAVLLGLFAALALGISATGIGGVIAYSVSQRTREFGVRMALGAGASRVVALVLRQGLVALAAGLLLGALAALGAGRLLSGLLFGVEPKDPVSYAAAAGVLLAVGLAACLLPARRAAATDPMTALRDA